MRGCAGAGARELRCSVVNHKALISLSVAFGGAASLARPSSAPPPCEVTQGHVGKENSSDRIVQDATIFFPTRVRRPLCIGLPPHAGALACSFDRVRGRESSGAEAEGDEAAKSFVRSPASSLQGIRAADCSL